MGNHTVMLNVGVRWAVHVHFSHYQDTFVEELRVTILAEFPSATDHEPRQRCVSFMSSITELTSRFDQVAMSSRSTESEQEQGQKGISKGNQLLSSSSSDSVRLSPRA